MNINICSFPLRNLTFRTCLCNYGTLYISCRDMKNKYSYLNSKYQTSDTYSVFLKSKLNIRESTEVAIHPGTRGATVPLPWYEPKGRGGTSPSQRWPSSYHPPPGDSCRAYQCSLRHPRGATPPSSTSGSRSSTGGFHSASQQVL